MTEFDHLFMGLPSETHPYFNEICSFCLRHRSTILAALPWIAAEIGDSQGFPQMLSFIVRLSGARVHVSRDTGRFRKRIGIDLSVDTHMRILRQAGDSALVDIPSAWGIFLTLRRVAIHNALAENASPRAVARRFGVSERSLRS